MCLGDNESDVICNHTCSAAALFTMQCSVEDTGSREEPQRGTVWGVSGTGGWILAHAIAITASSFFVYVTNQVHSPTTTVDAMGDIVTVLGLLVAELSDENYRQSLAFYRFWFGIGQTYHKTPSDRIFDSVWDNRTVGSKIDPGRGELIHSNARLILRLASDTESDPVLPPHSPGFQNRLYTKSLPQFFSGNIDAVWAKENGWGVSTIEFYTDANFIAHWANLGYVEEAAIRHHILQSLISHKKLYAHQADALIILFKLAGATFEAYADPSVVDRCFDLLKAQYSYDWVRGKLV